MLLICKEMALIGTTVCSSQQRKSSSFGRSSVTVCLFTVEVHPSKPAIFLLAVSCLIVLVVV